MYSALENLCQAVLFLCAPALLIGKFFWRQRIPWWSVVLVVIVSSTVSGVAFDKFGPLAHFERYDACSRDALLNQAEIDCGAFTYDVWNIPIFLKWVPGLILLLVSLPFYGLAVWLRSRRRRLRAA